MIRKNFSLKSRVGFMCLAAMVGLGSCSREDPTPETSYPISKDGSSMKMDGSLFTISYIPPTVGSIGQKGFFIAPEWFSTVSKQGVSNYSHVFGDLGKPWVNPLLVVPGSPNFLTFIVAGDEPSEYAKTTIKGLTPGKKYRVTYKVSYAISPAYSTPGVPWLDPHVQVLINGTNKLVGHEEIDLSGKKDQWVTVSTTFIAEEKTHSFEVYPSAAIGDVLINLIVPKNALEQIN